MGKSIAIDTNVFIHSCSTEVDWFMECLSLVVKIYEGKLIIAVDEEGKIFSEYKSNLLKLDKRNQVVNGMLQIINQEKRQRQRTKNVPMISSKRVKYLLDAGFHDKDIIFVKIAPNTSLKTIVSSDSRSFLDDKYKQSIENNLGVFVKHPRDCKDIELGAP